MSVFHQATLANSASYLSSTGNEYLPKYSDALQLGSKDIKAGVAYSA